MPMWANDDDFSDKPMFPFVRQVRQAVNANTGTSIQLTVASTVTTGNTVTFTGANSVVLANIVSGMYAYDTSLVNSITYIGDSPVIQNHIDFFTTGNNVTVVSASGNTVIFSGNVYSTVAAGNVIAFGVPINRGTVLYANNYTQDVILITASRSANNTTATGAIANVGNLNTGWNKITKKVNNDGTIRYLKETLVVLANSYASNTNSGNTSFGKFVSGL